MSVLNSQNCKYVLHQYDPLQQPHTPTWSAIIRYFIEEYYLEILNESVLSQIHEYWVMDSIQLHKGESQYLVLNDPDFEVYNLILGKNATLTLRFENNMESSSMECPPFHITVWNDLILNKNARLFIEATRSFDADLMIEGIACLGMVFNRGHIWVNKRRIQCRTDTLDQYICDSLISVKLDALDTVLRHSHHLPHHHITSSSSSSSSTPLSIDLKPSKSTTRCIIPILQYIDNTLIRRKLCEYLNIHSFPIVFCHQLIWNLFALNIVDDAVISDLVHSEFGCLMIHYLRTTPHFTLTLLKKKKKNGTRTDLYDTTFWVFMRLVSSAVNTKDDYLSTDYLNDAIAICHMILNSNNKDAVKCIFPIYSSMTLWKEEREKEKNESLFIDTHHDYQHLVTGYVHQIGRDVGNESFECNHIHSVITLILLFGGDCVLPFDIHGIHLVIDLIDYTENDENHDDTTNNTNANAVTMDALGYISYILEVGIPWHIDYMISIQLHRKLIEFIFRNSYRPLHVPIMCECLYITSRLLLDDDLDDIHDVNSIRSIYDMLGHLVTDINLRRFCCEQIPDAVSEQAIQWQVIVLILTMIHKEKKKNQHRVGDEQEERKEWYICDALRWFKWLKQRPVADQRTLIQSERVQFQAQRLLQFHDERVRSKVMELMNVIHSETAKQSFFSGMSLDGNHGMHSVDSFIFMPSLIDPDLLIPSMSMSPLRKRNHSINDIAVKCKSAIISLKLSNSALTKNGICRVIQDLMDIFPNPRCQLKVYHQNFGEIIHIALDGKVMGMINVDSCHLIPRLAHYWHHHFASISEEEPPPPLLVDFVTLLECLSALDLWSRIASIWRSFVDHGFISKLRKCYLSPHHALRHKACIVWVHLVNEANIMGVNDLCPMAIKPSIDLLSSEERHYQRIAIQAVSKMVIGQPLHVYMALDYGVLEYLLPIIVSLIHCNDTYGDDGDHVNDGDGGNGDDEMESMDTESIRLTTSSEMDQSLQEAIDLLLHLSNPNMDQKHLPQILDGLALAMNVETFESQEMLCRIYSEFTHPNQSRINGQVVDSIILSTKQYHYHDELLMSGYLRELTVKHGINGVKEDTEVWKGLVSECVLFSRLYRNVMEFVVNSVDSFHDASAVLVHLVKSMDEEEAMQLMFDHGAAHKLISFMDSQPYFGMTNVTLILSQMSESHANRLLQYDIIGTLKRALLDFSSYKSVLQNILWTLGYLANHSIEVRDSLLDQGLLNYLTVVSEPWTVSKPDEGTLNAINWLLTNLCNGSSFPNHYLAPLLKVISDCAMSGKCSDALEDVCWVCFDLTRHFNVDILIDDGRLVDDYNNVHNTYLVTGYLRTIDLNQHIIPEDVVLETLSFHSTFALNIVENPMASMITFLRHKNHEVRDIALKVAGNMVASGPKATDYAINNGLMEHIRVLLTSYRYGQTDRKDVYWMLSNVCLGSPQYIDTVITDIMLNKDIAIMETLMTPRSDFDVALHAFYAVSNAIYGAQQRQIEMLIQCNVMFAIFQFMQRIKDDVELLVLVLETVERLQSSIGMEMRNQLMDKCNGLAVLQDLRTAEAFSCNLKLQGVISRMFSVLL